MAPTADTAYKQQVAARDLTIGRTIDTSDDTARLMLVTHYAGTKMVSVYSQAWEPVRLLARRRVYLSPIGDEDEWG